MTRPPSRPERNPHLLCSLRRRCWPRGQAHGRYSSTSSLPPIFGDGYSRSMYTDCTSGPWNLEFIATDDVGNEVAASAHIAGDLTDGLAARKRRRKVFLGQGSIGSSISWRPLEPTSLRPRVLEQHATKRLEIEPVRQRNRPRRAATLEICVDPLQLRRGPGGPGAGKDGLHSKGGLQRSGSLETLRSSQSSA